MSVSRELTKGEVNRLEATATSAEDHLTVARFYRAEGNGLDAQAARYEDAAANLWEGPVVKKLNVADHGRSVCIRREGVSR